MHNQINTTQSKPISTGLTPISYIWLENSSVPKYVQQTYQIFRKSTSQNDLWAWPLIDTVCCLIVSYYILQYISHGWRRDKLFLCIFSLVGKERHFDFAALFSTLFISKWLFEHILSCIKDSLHVISQNDWQYMMCFAEKICQTTLFPQLSFCQAPDSRKHSIRSQNFSLCFHYLASLISFACW